ncbi:MAG: Asp-tRNA(Asn)/Glu-tRNA(Gln) amidotransferase subunit GatB [Puniceicoccales bacterium]|jgi:aspartyl-tRNA(Asn)/glutamyl-tRNA(Gln) amidotransferase subunit B|nr:Asp-tRNA(Asn)/Glu-tRNA(Gln) amidotransferase subunit GatB [Puniceicoccales bacterium]
MGGEKKYEAVIGLEVHVQLKTRSKAFSGSRCGFGEAPNTATDPVVMGLPGALPVINHEAIQQTIRAGLMFNCDISPICRWDRKNYFYPDNPKNYQISQQGLPICLGGLVEIELPGPARNIMGLHRSVKLNRIHLEEDVGKLTHYGDHSLIDFNRAGMPLAEIVSEPDIFSADEAAACLNAIRMSLESAGISDCDMEKGQMRCDVNISLRPAGSEELGKRTELKNLNSISGVRNAIAYEIKRQREVLEGGGTLRQETRRWDMVQGVSEGMRGKENAQDYCYFPEPDLMPVHIIPEFIEKLREELPEPPFVRQRRYMEQFDLPYTITSVICFDRTLSEFFEKTLTFHHNPRGNANLIINDLLRELSQNSLPPGDMGIQPKDLAQLVKLSDGGQISKQAAQDVLVEVFRTHEDVDTIIRRLGCIQSQDPAELVAICREVIEKNQKAVGEFRSGKTAAINALKGQVMKVSAGKANPAQVDSTLRELLR